MAYRLRIYAPTSQYYDNIVVIAPGNNVVNVTPLGASTPCYDVYISSGDIRVGPNIKEGQEDTFANQVFQQWVVNLDGYVTTLQTPFIYLGFPTYSKYSDVSIRLEINEPEPPKKYYAQLAFDANGGYNAPAKISGSMLNTQPYVRFSIPATTPTRAGYVFAGWTLDQEGKGQVYIHGDPTYGHIDLYGYNYSPGPTYTLYAVWTEDMSGMGWISPNGTGYNRGIMWLYANYWRKGIPWICLGGTTWKRGG